MYGRKRERERERERDWDERDVYADDRRYILSTRERGYATTTKRKNRREEERK
jgi:hypothetical protein